MLGRPSWKSAEIGRNQKTEEKGLFPQISSDFLKPPSLKPPFAALQTPLLRTLFPFMGNGQSTVSRVLFRKRKLTEFCAKLGKFCEGLDDFDFALAHK